MATALTTATPSRDAVRIKVIQHSHCEVDSQCCRFSVDPELTGYEVLRNLIARAFDLKGEFQTCYLARDDRFPEACWVPMSSDFDLEMAFVKSADPYLLVKVELSSSNGTWDAVTNMDIAKLSLPDLPRNNYSAKLPGIFKEKMEKTLSIVQKALSWNEEGDEASFRPIRPPLTDSEFQQMLNRVGQLAHPKELRLCVYLGGLEPSLRKVIWKHLLNVYPEGLTGRERLDYMKQKTKEYEALRAVWQEHLNDDNQNEIADQTAEHHILVSEEVKYVTNMVRKDVLRTDRHHSYFSGPDDNSNVQSLYNILTTYALNHPSVGYCQGMSDLASPLLVTMRDEAQAYVCFCALMARVHSNFHIDGNAMTLKFQHLTEALIFYDIEYFSYLQLHQADDLLFCYRWLLLELKREFAFDDALYMLEVLWSSLPPNPPEESLPLFEVQFNPVQEEETPVPPPTPRQNHYDNVCALRRQRSCVSNRSAECLAAILSRRAASVDCDGPETGAGGKKLSRTWSQPIDTSRVRTRVPSGETAMNVDRIREESTSPEDSPTRNIRKIRNLREFQLLTKNKDSDCESNPASPCKDKKISNRKKDENFKSVSVLGENLSNKSRRCFSDSDADVGVPVYSDGGEVDVWQNPVATLSPETDQQLQIVCQEEQPTTIQQLTPKTNGQHQQSEVEGENEATMTASVNSCEEVTEVTGWQVTVSASGSPQVHTMPPPEEFGGGNPFLMFLCLTLLLQHRQLIMQNKMDHNELAMHFDKMVRQHNVNKVLGQARRMFETYLKLDFSKARSKNTPPSSTSNQSC
ncbi:TBC1 domain family member 25-like isoform X2 [Homarus americanus]|uniref:TBC1 domain family member 25-like isoform X2 n=1 Tax=Homarus americanus TaxID=6706 RepID=UPI001C47A32E|nr:TBC1 domain family member 25-like isoform X2 [Homarus americanus]